MSRLCLVLKAEVLEYFWVYLAHSIRMYTIPRIAFFLLATLLLTAIARLSGLLSLSLSSWVVWSLHGLTIVLFIGILLTGLRMRAAGSHQQVTLESLVAQRTEELRVANQELEQEIAYRKQAEDALAQRVEEELSVSNARFRAIFNDAAVGVGIMGLDRRIIDANPAICQMFGRTREELIGMNAVEATYPGDVNESTKLFDKLLSAQRTSYKAERRYMRKNGEVFWAHVTMSSVSGLDGKPRYLVGMVIDIDEQKKMQEQIRESEARFRAMFDHAALGMSLMSLDRHVLQVNRAAERITGYSVSELINVNPALLAHPEDRYLDRELFEQLVKGARDQYQMEKRYYRKDGSLFWGRVTYTCVRDANALPEYLIGVIEDITEQHQTHQQLKEQENDYRRTLEQSVEERTHKLEAANQRLKEEIEGRVIIEEQLAKKAAEEAVTSERTRLARDLHDAVTQTLFSASLIAEVLPDLWDIDVKEAMNSTEELRQLTRGALAEMRTLLLELRPAALTQTRLSDLIKQLCEAFIGRSRLPIKLSIEGDRILPPEVQVAFYRIAQESLNNVFKYARATQVNVSLFLSVSGARFEVCDNGIGFDLSTSKPMSLGMRIMHERAEAIGANFHLSSTPGSGTCVAVRWTENPDLKLHVL
jgi:PAS domain S-box-containing protein